MSSSRLPLKTFRAKIVRASTLLSLAALLSSIGFMSGTSASGEPKWTPASTGVVVSDGTDPAEIQTGAQIVRSNFSSARFYIVVWQDNRGGNYDIYGQRYNQNGVAQWTVGGKVLVTATGNQPASSNISLAADGAGGAILSWHDNRSGENIYALRIDENGDPVTGWTANGDKVSSDPTAIYGAPKILTDSSSGAYIAWTQKTGSSCDVLARHIESNGDFDATWDGGGSPRSVAATADSEFYPQIVTDNSNGAIITYELSTSDCSSGPPEAQNILASKITSAGTASWSAQAIADTATSETSHRTVASGSGSIITTYTFGAAADSEDIRAQKLNSSGAKQWTSTGEIISDQTNDQVNSRIISDNSTGAIIVWEDGRGAQTDIYAQRVDTSGNSLWTTDGVAISSTGDGLVQDQPVLATNSQSGAVIAFRSNAESLYAQHINGSGSAKWTAGGVAVESSNRIDSTPVIADNNNAGAVIAWNGDNGTNPDDVFIQYMQDSQGGVCAEASVETFCGNIEIADFTLTFNNIPDSFTFGTVTEGAIQDVFNNTTPPDVNEPAVADEITIFDDRGSGDCNGGGCGGFIVDVTTDGTFTNGTDTIPLTNLYVVTSLDPLDDNNSPPPVNEEAGVTYSVSIPSSLRTVEAPAYVNVNSANLTNRSTYTGIGAAGQFGSSPLVIMDGTLAATLGRNGTMSLFTNFHLRIDAPQEDGDYYVILTYTLSDSST